MPADPTALDVELVALDSIAPHPDNARHGDLPVIIESLRVHGFYGTIVVQSSTRYAIAGNHRWHGLWAARDHCNNADPGWEHWPAGAFDRVRVHWVNVEDDEAIEIMLIDNKSSDDANYYDDRLAALLGRVRDERWSATGWEPADLDAVRRRLTPPDFDAMERLFGHPDEHAQSLWPSVRLALHPDVLARWQRRLAATPGETDCDRVVVLLDLLDNLTPVVEDTRDADDANANA